MDIGQAFFSFIATPDVAYVLLMLGLFSLVMAMAAPGTGFAEIAAVLCLLLALIGLVQLPVNVAGLLLILLGIGLFIADLKLQTWAIAIGGGVALAIGSFFLFEFREEAVRVSIWLIAGATIGSVAFFGFAIDRVVAAMRQRPRMDPKSIVGASGVVRTPILAANQMTGTAQVEGELWSVRSEQPIAAGTTVAVINIAGATLIVKPVEDRPQV